MPVIGHAFVGLATASCTRRRMGLPSRAPWWSAVGVALAYLPDGAAVLARLAGAPNVRFVTHSLLFALLAAAAAAVIMRRLFAMSFRTAFAVAVFSILVHDLLDAVQSTDRRLWWPLSNRPIGLDVSIIPVNSYQELVLFGVPWCLFVGVRAWMSRKRTTPPAAPVTDRHAVWTGRIVVWLILICASGTHYLRGSRERDLAAVGRLMHERQFTAALEKIEGARRWPAIARPGRLDYAAAEAYLGLADRGRAEVSFHRSFEADPTYFWVVADLGVFYASGDESQTVRRQRAAPHVRRLTDHFSTHPQLQRVLAKIERKLAEPKP